MYWGLLWFLNFSFFLAHQESLIHICAYLEYFYIIFFIVKYILLFLADTEKQHAAFLQVCSLFMYKGMNIIFYLALIICAPSKHTSGFYNITPSLSCSVNSNFTNQALSSASKYQSKKIDGVIILGTSPSIKARVDSHKEFKWQKILNTDQ